MEKSNLVSLNKLKSVAKIKGLDKYYKEIGYSTAKGKKYYVKTIDGKKVNFGSILYQDFLIHKNKERQNRFLKRFNKLYMKHQNEYNKPIFWAVRLLW